jgi:hypothetical protein
MAMMWLVVMVCATSQPKLCEDQHFQFVWSGSLQQCAVAAQPYIAQWVGEHPGWAAMRWHCEHPGKQKI